MVILGFPSEPSLAGARETGQSPHMERAYGRKERREGRKAGILLCFWWSRKLGELTLLGHWPWGPAPFLRGGLLGGLGSGGKDINYRK